MDRTDLRVETLRWPDDVGRLDHLRRLGVPRLLLVAPGWPPPLYECHLEDWIRLPADEHELKLRAERLDRLASEDGSDA